MVLIVVTFIFWLTRMLPGNPVLYRLPLRYTQEQYDRMAAKLGLDKPVFVQYIIFIKDMFLGNWGRSYTIVHEGYVWDIIMQHLPRTVESMVLSMTIAIFMGIKLGTIASKKKGRLKDKGIRAFIYVFLAIPSFLIASYLVTTILNTGIKILPYNGYKSKWIANPPLITRSRIIDCILTFNYYMLGDYLWHLLLPIGSMIFYQIVVIARHIRASMIHIIQEDYIRTAIAKSVDKKTIYNTHALRNALPATMTVSGMAFPVLFAGNIAIEEAFNLAGLGQLFLHALKWIDYPLIIAIIYACT